MPAKPLVTLLAQDAPPPPVDPTLFGACGEEPTLLCEWVFGQTNSEGWSKAADFLLGRPLKVVFVLVLAWFVNRLIRRAIKRFVQEMQEPQTRQRLGTLKRRARLDALSSGRLPSVRQAQRAEAIGALLRSASSVLVWGFAILIVLGTFEIELAPLIAGAGIVGVALGFGAQNLVRDFLSGIFMLVEDQYGVGDAVDVGDAIGIVEGLSLRTTRVRSVDGVLWHVPNGEIRRVGNMSQGWSRALLDIEVAYDTDIELAKGVIKDVADVYRETEAGTELVLEEPEVWGVENLGADGIAIRLVVKTVPLKQWEVARELRQRLKAAFDEEGIEIPFPQRTIWVRGEGGALPGTDGDQPGE
ncbi:MAG: mechanosensitive ion channel family protein [Actinobacteria bacterium]|nr:mechanosensitive ion channel family protein [Actinomycetota bacterium]